MAVPAERTVELARVAERGAGVVDQHRGGPQRERTADRLSMSARPEEGAAVLSDTLGQGREVGDLRAPPVGADHQRRARRHHPAAEPQQPQRAAVEPLRQVHA
jgi:hypothetical protein